MWVKFLAGFDIHGDKQDKAACDVFFKFSEIWKPKIRICGGDLFDLRPLRKGASADEQRESLEKDWEAGTEWFEKFKPNYFLRGNHDERLYDLASHGVGLAGDWAGSKVGQLEALVKKHHCWMLPYHKRDGLLKLGRMKLLHGFYCGIYAARQTAMVYGSCLFGHVHTIDEHSIPGLDRRVARASGCLASTDLEYSNRQPNTLRQANGFPYGLLNDKTGDYRVFQAEEIGGKWILPTDTVQL